MGAEKPYKVLTESIKETKYEHFITMNHRNTGNMNPVVFSMLQSTTPGVFGHVELGELDNEGARAALAASTPDSPGRLPLNTADSGTTARFTMTRLVAAHPILRVPRGRIRKFPVKLDDSGKFLVINLKDTSVEVVSSGPTAAKPPKSDSASGAQAESEAESEAEE
ncbi:MAG TPA: hypothetical protein VK464_20325 [Symbiobacteriaceae bacterium]|jgi:hypothetical protein|nr:hypothetical protein [Symbiobacteriaceae bacterium]